MQTNALRSSLSIGSNTTIDKAKAMQQEHSFANRLKEITDAQKTAGGTEDAKLRQVCKDMEAVFLGMMLKQMRATVPKTGLMGGKSNASEIYQSMLDDEMSQEMAKAGGIGLGDMLYRQLSRDNGNITDSPSRRPVKQAGE